MDKSNIQNTNNNLEFNHMNAISNETQRSDGRKIKYKKNVKMNKKEHGKLLDIKKLAHNLPTINSSDSEF